MPQGRVRVHVIDSELVIAVEPLRSVSITIVVALILLFVSGLIVGAAAVLTHLPLWVGAVFLLGYGGMVVCGASVLIWNYGSRLEIAIGADHFCWTRSTMGIRRRRSVPSGRIEEVAIRRKGLKSDPNDYQFSGVGRWSITLREERGSLTICRYLTRVDASLLKETMTDRGVVVRAE
jgi:hypothetical protein